jgi:hypothetical protein
MITRSASGEGESLKARHRRSAANSQFRTMRIRAADDEAGVEMIHHLLIYRLSINELSNIVKTILKVDK